MKALLIILQSAIFSTIITAQNNSNTTIQPASENKDMKFGKFVLEMPFSAKLYKADDSSANKFIENLKTSFTGKALYFDF